MYWIIDLSFAYKSRFDFCGTQVRKISSNPGRVNFEDLVYLLRYIRDNNILGLNYYAGMKDEPLSGLLIQANIKTENQLMVSSYCRWKGFPDTDRSTGAYIMFYQEGTIDHGTNIPGPVDKSIA